MELLCFRNYPYRNAAYTAIEGTSGRYMNPKCALFHCQSPIRYVRTSGGLIADDLYCEGHGSACKDFMVNTPTFSWHLYKDYTEQQETIKHQEQVLEDARTYERSREIEKRQELYNTLKEEGWIWCDGSEPPLNVVVILSDEVSSYAGFRVRGKEYRALNSAGISIRKPEPKRWMPLVGK